MSPPSTSGTRPAELAGATGALALLISRVAGLNDPDVLMAIGVIAASTPAAVTAIVAGGGIRGYAHALWRGR
jgi:hypothetical protein